MTQLSMHPSDDVIRDFLLGKLSDPTDREIERHFDDCTECQELAAANCAADTFVELLISARTRIVAERRAATSPTLSAIVTPSFAPTHGWGHIAAADSATEIPTELAGHPKYRVLRRLGVGGMGSVWLAEHTVMNRLVAVKVIRQDVLVRPKVVERFMREVRAAAKLQHPNIVTAFDAEQANGSCLLAMEYVPGETLAEAVLAGPLTAVDACRAVRDAAHGLAHAHAAGLVHRDVKPSNLIRTLDGTTKVLDFGLVVAAVDREAGLTGENMVMGTPDYIAPEQAEDARTADARSDVYSLGCTLYHLLAGRVPFPASTVLKKIDAHRTGEPKPILGIPAALAALVAKMMAKNPADRFQTAAEVEEVLEPFTTRRAGGVSPLMSDIDANSNSASDSGSIRGLTPPARRGRRWMIAVGVSFAFTCIAAGAVVYKIQRDNEVITVETDDPDIEIVMKRNGDIVRIVDTKTKQSWDLDTKKMRLKPDGGELTIDLPGKEPLVIRRNGDVAVTIVRQPANPPAVEPNSPAIPPLEVRRFGASDHAIISLALSRDGRTALSAGADGTARYWDVATGKLIYKLGNPGKQVYGVAISADGTKLLSCGEDMLIHVWDGATGKEIKQLKGHSSLVQGVSITPDNKWVASGSWDGTVRLWDLEKGTQIHSFTSQSSGVAFSPDGNLLASWGPDTTVRLYDVKLRKEVQCLRGHSTLVRAGNFSADGSRFLSGSNAPSGSGNLCLWDVQTGKLLRSIDGIPYGSHGVAIAADGVRALRTRPRTTP